MGSAFDEKALKTLPTGSFLVMPTTMPHFAAAPEGATLQFHGTAPFDVKYVNPADDPRNKK
jgi:hypothetical protein